MYVDRSHELAPRIDLHGDSEEIVDRMIYSTQDVHPRERLSYWREVATRGYVDHDFEPSQGQAFSGTVKIASLPGLAITRFNSDAARVSRSERSAARADSGDLLLCMHRYGELAVSQDGRDTVISDRALFLLDPLRPFELQLRSNVSNIVVKIPRAVLEARVGNTGNLTARAIPLSNTVAALTMGFLDMLPDLAEELDDIAGLKVAEQLLDLTALALTAEQKQFTGLSSSRATASLRLKATIERLLIEPGLKPERIAAETGISIRYANDLLAEENSSIERYVNMRRLERCRAALEDVAQSHRSVGEIAFKWGFSDLSHFGRRFKAKYGLTPTEFRRRSEIAAAERQNQPKRPVILGFHDVT
jgi:AraC family transcriptional regulator, positive regulator of tynA and feaB